MDFAILEGVSMAGRACAVIAGTAMVCMATAAWAQEVYPLFRFILLRTRPADLYVDYSLAGPSYISQTEIDGRDTGARFTFQDFVGVGLFLNEDRRCNAEIGIKHFSPP
jgi:Lipid A 3-O-deacylase (PagL)